MSDRMLVVTAGRWYAHRWTRPSAGLQGPLYRVKVYEAKPRKDGTYTWRLLKVVPEIPPFTVWATVNKAAQKYAAKNNLLYLPKVRQGALLPKVIE